MYSKMEDKMAKSISVALDMFSDRKLLNIDESSKKGYIELIRKSDHDGILELIINSIKIIYYLKNKYKIAEVINLFNDNDVINNYLIIINTEFKPKDLKKIETQLVAKDIDFQVFHLNQLQFNPSHHNLVPKHEVIDPEELELVKDCYGLRSLDQLPIILTTDPMAKYLALKPGQVVRIIRENSHSGKSVFFRLCQDPIE